MTAWIRITPGGHPARYWNTAQPITFDTLDRAKSEAAARNVLAHDHGFTFRYDAVDVEPPEGT